MNAQITEEFDGTETTSFPSPAEIRRSWLLAVGSFLVQGGFIMAMACFILRHVAPPAATGSELTNLVFGLGLAGAVFFLACIGLWTKWTVNVCREIRNGSEQPATKKWARYGQLAYYCGAAAGICLLPLFIAVVT
jgi:hypothetical protein